jgi:hypothetical protein
LSDLRSPRQDRAYVARDQVGPDDPELDLLDGRVFVHAPAGELIETLPSE